MIYLEALGKRVLFLNSYKAATDLMEKHSQVCSSRPSSSMGDLYAFVKLIFHNSRILINRSWTLLG